MGLVAALVVLATGAFAHPAGASTIAFDNGTQQVTYAGSPGETNYLMVTVTADGANYVFTESLGGVTITDGDGAGGCAVDPVATNIARCPAAAVKRLSISGGDQDDWLCLAPTDPACAQRVTGPMLTEVAPPNGTVLNGDDGHDIIEGSSADDQLNGGTGADRLIGNAGNDVFDTGHGGYDPNSEPCQTGSQPFDPPLCQDETDGGSGIDTLTYANRPYPVYIDGRAQSQSRFASLGVDDPKPECMADLNAGSNPNCEVDQVAGFIRAAPMEKFIGTRFDDTIIGNKRDNLLIGGTGADVLCGELGKDTVDYSDQTEAVSVSLDGDPALPTDPRVTGAGIGAPRTDCRGLNAQSAPIPPGPNAPRDCTPDDGNSNDGPPGARDCVGQDVENVIGGRGNDTLIGNSPDPLYREAPLAEPQGANVLNGGPGDDTLQGLYGPDLLNGGSENDTVTYAERPAGEATSLGIDGAGNDGSTDSTGLASDLNPSNGRMDTISPDVENIIGGAGNDVIRGDSADNTLKGGGGNDDIEGGPGADMIEGAGGEDGLRGGEGNDILGGNDGNDVLVGDEGNDSLNGGAGNDLMHGGNGADDLIGGDGNDSVDWADATSSVSVSINGINDDGRDGEHDNVFSDVEGANGGLADDHLVLGAGDGFIAGGPGNDYIDGGPGADSIEGKAGLDTVDYSNRAGPVSVDVNSPGGDGEAGENDDVFFDVEEIVGGPGNDMLVGSGWANILIGNGGDDQLYGNNGDDQLFGGSGKDGLDGGNHNDTLDGGDNNDNLFGGSGQDTLLGGGGDDSLDGGVGPDAFSGGGGTDTATYASRTKALNLSFDGNSNDGESGEKDVIKMDVENTNAGSGNDIVNSLNEVKNTVSCGRGSDAIAADTFDDIKGDCERIINTSPCKASPSPATMSGSGVVTIRVSCTQDASGSLQLRTAGKVKTSANSKHSKRLILGRKGFKLKRGQSVKLKVKIKGAGKRVIKRSKKGITARSMVTVRQSFGVRSLSLRKGDKLKIKAKK
jgi:Ca2+-binding RTX toxin-like protein